MTDRNPLDAAFIGKRAGEEISRSIAQRVASGKASREKATEGRKAIPMGPMGETLKGNIKRIREAQRLTYVALSERLAELGRPIPVLGLRRIERGERRVDVDDLNTLAAALKVTCAQLMESPAECAACHGTPPVGFSCLTCGSGKERRDA